MGVDAPKAATEVGQGWLSDGRACGGTEIKSAESGSIEREQTKWRKAKLARRDKRRGDKSFDEGRDE